MLVLTRKPSEKIRISDNITVTVLRINGSSVRLGIEAPREMRVVRGELPPLPQATGDSPGQPDRSAKCDATSSGGVPTISTERPPALRDFLVSMLPGT